MARVFLSYSTADLGLARTLHDHLAERIDVWFDLNKVEAGDALTPAIQQAINEAEAVVLLLTPRSLQSKWVRAEVAHAQASKRRIIPVWHDLGTGDLPAPFDAALGDLRRVPLEPVDGARHFVLSALGLDPLGEPHHFELVFEAPALVKAEDGKARVEATVRWGDRSGPFRSPPGHADELRWYLERYYIWPADEFVKRAERLEAELPKWGRALWDAVLAALGEGAQEAFTEWLDTSEKGRRIMDLRVDAPDPDHVDEGLRQGSAALLALPWELLRDREGWLFQRFALRRRVPGGRPVRTSGQRIKVLAVVARPEKAGLIDTRTADALLDAVAPLGSAVEVHFLRPPTVPALEAALKGGSYDVLHFDGHGLYRHDTGLGYLCFEHADPERRRAGEPHTISGQDLKELLGQVRLPLVFLQACQSADEGQNPGSAVASALLAAGAGSVIAMSHSVLVETARRFTRALYAELCEGLTVSGAVTRARAALHTDHNRGRVGQGMKFELRDWFVPVLLQRGEDLPLLPGGVAVHRPPAAEEEARRFPIRSLPNLEHSFVGRLKERLALERAFEVPRAAHLSAAEPRRIGLIIGVGGQGKTTLAAEMGRWLYRTGRFPGGVAFVSLEQVSDLTGVLSTLGCAVIPGFALRDVEQGKSELVAHLRAKETLIVFDNFESVLPPAPDSSRAEQWLHEPEFLTALLDLAYEMAGVGQSRVLITSREAIDDDRFRSGKTTCVVTLGGLGREEAIELVGEICRHQGISPEAASDEALGKLVDAVSCHPQSLVLLPPLLKERGVVEVTKNLHALMAELERKYPGQREKSLFASVKLSLDRLPQWVREKLAPLGLLRVGAAFGVLHHLLQLEQNEVLPFVEILIRQALVTQEREYLRFHPALAPLMEDELKLVRSSEVPALRALIVEIYDGLTQTLYREKDGPRRSLVTGVATRELPNLLTVLDSLATTSNAEALDRAIYYATRLEGLLQNSPQHRPLACVAAVRADLAKRRAACGDWSRAQFASARASIDRLLEAGKTNDAVAPAESLAAQCDAEVTKPTPYPWAAYDRALAYFSLGRTLKAAGRSADGLAEVEKARIMFLAIAGELEPAARMATSCLNEAGECLRDLGRFEAAESIQELALEEHATRNDGRSVAATRNNLAIVRLNHRRYAEALSDFHAARQAFIALDEPASVAGVWHQIGMVHQEVKEYAKAETAYTNALSLWQRLNNKVGEAQTIHQLAMVTDRLGRLEEAVAWDRRALKLKVAIGNRKLEATSRTSLAHRLHRMGLPDDAEAEARQSLGIVEEIGLGAEPWRTWGVLHDIAQSRGDQTAMASARIKAMDWYRLYRARGGSPQTPIVKLFQATSEALAGNAATRASLVTLFATQAPDSPEVRPLLAALIALLQGDLATARAPLPELDYANAVELERLLAGTWP
jgi:tetratricopeptide (TPR) repeat protein